MAGRFSAPKIAVDAAAKVFYLSVIMNKVSQLVLTGILSVSLPSCGGAVGETLRPTDQTAAGALGGKGAVCSGEPKYAKPLIVDLDPDARVDLEASMKKGVAVVAYDCASFRVLSTCKIADSAYEYAGVSRREQVVQMNSMDDLHANMPISSAKLGAEIKSGRSIDLALVLVGQRTTTLAKLSRDDLAGSCDGATHFVQTATLGAFSMATGSVGKAAVVAEMFNYGGGAKSESERKAMNKDGSLDDCRKSEPDAESPPGECRSPLRIELSPIAGTVAVVKGEKSKGGEKTKESAAAESPCPEGFNYVDGLCTRGAAQAHLCDPKDEADCKAQCDKGSAESCFNYGRLVRKKTSRAAAMPFQKKACDGGFADGCAELGVSMLPVDEGPNVEKEARAAIAMLTKACDMGSGYGCDSAGDALSDAEYKQVDQAAARKRYDRGCDLGYGTACWSLSHLYFKGDGVPKDSTKGVALLLKACQGANGDECAELGTIYGKGKYDIAVDKEKAYRFYRRACDLDGWYCSDAAKAAGAVGKDSDAFTLAQRGCKIEDDEACVMVGDFYSKGKGTTQDEEKAKAVWKASCKNGEGDDDACKRIGVPVKD
jgi:TPR repeat protein